MLCVCVCWSLFVYLFEPAVRILFHLYYISRSCEMKYGCAPKSFNVHKNAGRLDIHLIQHPVRKTNALVRFRRAIFHSSDTFRTEEMNLFLWNGLRFSLMLSNYFSGSMEFKINNVASVFCAVGRF